MPRFPVAFGKRKSTANILEDVPVAGPSFRVLDRTELASGKSFDGGARLAAKTQHLPQASVSSIYVEDNIFAGLNTNRGSGSSNTTKTASTDNSSRHSNASTAPSSADLAIQEEWRASGRTQRGDRPTQPGVSKPPASGFLRNAGRSFSFGGQKKHLPPVPVAEEPIPDVPPPPVLTQMNGRARATTSSTSTTVTPPSLDSEVNLDLGGDFSKLFLSFDKRASVATVRNDAPVEPQSAPRNLTGGRSTQPSPLQLDKTSSVEPSPYSWNSQRSNDRMLTASPVLASPSTGGKGSLPSSRTSPVPMAQSRPDAALRRRSATLGRPPSMINSVDQEDEQTRLLKDSLSAVNKFMAGNVAETGSLARPKRNDETFSARGRQTTSQAKSPSEWKSKEDNLFDSSFAQAGNLARRYVARQPSPPRNKVMTPAQFERYREDRERRELSPSSSSKPTQENDEDENYEDEADDAEKAKELAKQRRKQEAHMTVYRQQMMKVTGESAGSGPSRPSLQLSFSTPNLANLGPAPAAAAGASPTDGSDEDEEVPLAILAAHGFPSKNRPPTRLSTMMSNPNLRASQMPSYQRPGSVVGDAAGAGGHGRLPAFAKNLPSDPFLGAGLVHNPVRESFALGGGAPAGVPPQPAHGPPVPPGGLIGVIANEERSRAMRRGSPHIDGQIPAPQGPNPYDPMNGFPAHMMYPGGPQMPNPAMLTPGDHAQMQMNQQMQQFMQMQMQFMQMMAAQNGGGAPRPASHMAAAQSMLNLPTMSGGLQAGGGMMDDGGAGDPMMRHSFLGEGSILDLPNGRSNNMRTMSMLQPSSASWIQPMPQQSYTPSIRAQGAGYAPSIAPSERSNVGLPGRYRPVSQAPPPMPFNAAKRTSTAPNLGNWTASARASQDVANKSGSTSDDDDEQGWEAMKARRDKKRSIWKSKKGFGAELGAMIS